MNVSASDDLAVRMRQAVVDVAAALSRLDVDALGPMLADNAVMELPYAPPEMGRRAEGRAAIVEALRVAPAMFSQFRLTPGASFVSQDAQSIIVEAESRGTFRDGGAYANKYVILFTFSGGKIALWREYFDPLRLGEAEERVQ